MTGLQRQTAVFKRRCEKAASAVDVDGMSVDVDFAFDGDGDRTVEDDGCLNVTRHGVRAMFAIGQDTPGEKANAATRTILTTLGMKRFINKSTLVEEECETCDGYGETTHECGHEHECDDCDGKGFTVPEDYK